MDRVTCDVLCGQDGKMTCTPESQDQCPHLECSRSEQVRVPGECCKYCKGTTTAGIGVRSGCQRAWEITGRV